MKIDVRANERPGDVRCAYCHASVGVSEPTWECPGCGALHHGACARELGRCAALGCTGAPRAKPVLLVSRPNTGRWDLVRLVAFGVLTVALAVVGFGGTISLVLHREDVHAISNAYLFAPLAIFALVAILLVGLRDRLR